jgi:hypothetical protein
MQQRSGQGYNLALDRIGPENSGLRVVDYESGKRKPIAREQAFDLQLTIYA